jgi:serine/threonine protein kinase
MENLDWCTKVSAVDDLAQGKDSVEYQRLLIELAILAGVGSHPNIVGFLGACMQDLTSPMIVKELVEGTSLEEHLDNRSTGFNIGQSKAFSL